MGLLAKQLRRLIRRESKLNPQQLSHGIHKESVASPPDFVFRPFGISHMLELVEENRQERCVESNLFKRIAKTLVACSRETGQRQRVPFADRSDCEINFADGPSGVSLQASRQRAVNHFRMMMSQAAANVGQPEFGNDDRRHSGECIAITLLDVVG